MRKWMLRAAITSNVFMMGCKIANIKSSASSTDTKTESNNDKTQHEEVTQYIVSHPRPAKETITELISSGYRTTCFVIVEENKHETKHSIDPAPPKYFFEVYAVPSCLTVASKDDPKRRQISPEMKSKRIARVRLQTTVWDNRQRWYSDYARIESVEGMKDNHFDADFRIDFKSVAIHIGADGVIDQFELKPKVY